MNTSELKKKGVSAVVWNLSGSMIKHFVTFLISVVLARLLSPSDFGLIGMSTVLISFAQGFSDFGLTGGLIRAKEPTESQYSSVFFFNMFASVILTIGLILSSGLIARFYKIPEIKPIIQVISVSFIIYGSISVHLAIFYKNLEVKILRISSIITAVITGIIGISLAYLDFGVWSLVYSNLIGNSINSLIIWKYSQWKPKLIFCYNDIKQLLNFGIKVFFINYLEQLYTKLDIFIIGKIFNPTTLGYYYRASSFNQLITKYSSQGLSGVFFPLISKLQDNHLEIRQIFIKSIHTVCFLSFFLCGLLYINAESLIILIFSSKWIPAIHYFKILAFSSYVYPMTIIFNGVLLGTGNSGNQLKLELLKKSIGILGLGVGFLIGMDGYLWSLVITTFFGLILSLYYIRKAISMPILNSLKYIYGYLVPLLIASILAMLLNRIQLENLFIQLILKSIIYSFLFILICKYLNLSGYLTIKGILLDYYKNNFEKHKRNLFNLIRR